MDNWAVGIASNFSLCKSAPVTETAQSLFTYSFLELNVFLFHFYCFNEIVTTNKEERFYLAYNSRSIIVGKAGQKLSITSTVQSRERG